MGGSFEPPILLRRKDSNLRPLGYEPNELPLLHSAMRFGCAKVLLSIKHTKLFVLNIKKIHKIDYFCNLKCRLWRTQ